MNDFQAALLGRAFAIFHAAVGLLIAGDKPAAVAKLRELVDFVDAVPTDAGGDNLPDGSPS